MIDEIQKELNEHIIPFWKGLKDNEYGGYYGYLDYDLKLDKKAEKGAILNSRILWFFSRAFNELKDKSLLEEAEHAYRFMKEKMIGDGTNGICWSVTYDGKVLDGTRHTYNQAFAIYALSEFYRASGEREALLMAHELFTVIEEKCRDNDGYLEAFDEDFNLLPNDKLSENGVMADRTMNTALHVLEAYTLLYEVTEDSGQKGAVGDRLAELLHIVKDRIYNKEKRRQEVFFDMNYNSLLDLHSYGHDIEASWLIDLALDTLDGKHLDKNDADEIRSMNLEMVENTYNKAFIDGSFVNECEEGKVDKTRIWWVQSEAMVGFVNGYQRSGETKYLQAAKSIWEYTKNHMIDKRPGSEWFWQVDEYANPGQRPIVEPWKCPYHNGRMCFEITKRLRKGEEQ
ncbi:AGE family epimerase/isomerase [Butyrivibrio sp. WCE2006]|uniref:AGE family epimerase/isomerase n=1 Tax=Butyrivibrio sp. WCE2006 TaxID=1410611 RepID=UPI0005D1A307|nr:AGE family epimerase/isomerase [Butyrivibrio sp. WCE2006]